VNDATARVLELLGERWTLLIAREVSLGLRRFDALQAATGAPRAVLADRLRRLTAAGIVATQPYRLAGHRTRSEYVLTAAGADLLPVLTALSDWGERHLSDDGAASDDSVVYRHLGCGGRVTAVLRCDCGAEALPADRLIAEVVR
jgi:DNA-binding HxlR family transcriptional regulator